jgi:hypothetical protein
MTRTPGWQHVDHDADMGIQGTGYTAAEAFEQVALGMTAIITDADIRRFSTPVTASSAPAASVSTFPAAFAR